MGRGVPPVGTLTRTMLAAGTVTEKLAPVVKALPAPGTEATAGFWVPLMLIQRNSWMGVAAPDLVVPAVAMVQMLPAVPGEKPERVMLTVLLLAVSLLTRKMVKFPAASLEAQQR